MSSPPFFIFFFFFFFGSNGRLYNPLGPDVARRRSFSTATALAMEDGNCSAKSTDVGATCADAGRVVNASRVEVSLGEVGGALPPISTVFFLAACVYLVFFCFLPAQTFAAVVFPGIGSLSISLLYTVFLFGVIFSPSILKKYGVGICVACGSSLYLPFAIAVCVESKTLLVIGSCLCGFGASLLWNGVGMLLTLLSNQKTRGRRSAVFAAVNRLNVTSNIFLGVGLSSGLGRSFLFIFIIAFGVLGTVFLFLHAICISRPLRLSQIDEEKLLDKNAKTVLENTKEALRLYMHEDYQPFLITNFLIYGVLKGWVYAELTTWGKEVGGDQVVAFVVGTYGIVTILSGLVHGKVFDSFGSKRGKIALFLSPLTLGATGLIIAFVTHIDFLSAPSTKLTSRNSVIVFFYVASGLIGASCGGVESCGYAITSFLYPAAEQTAIAVASKLYVEVAGQVFGFLFPTLFGSNVYAQIIFFVVAFLLNTVAICRYVIQVKNDGD